jgi:hypothetical protein
MCQNCNAEAKNIPKPKHYPRHWLYTRPTWYKCI